MKPPATLLRILLLGGVALGVARPAPAPTADLIIAQARAYLGGDAALSAVNSIHFSGVVETDKVTPAGLKTEKVGIDIICLLYTSPSPRDGLLSRMPSSA